MKKNINTIIENTVNTYIEKNILKEYSNPTIYNSFMNAIDNLYRAYNQMINDVNMRVNDRTVSKRDFIIQKIERDINELVKDVKHIQGTQKPLRN